MYLRYKSDYRLNLFGFHNREDSTHQITSDTYAKKVEEMLIKDYQQGGLVKVVKGVHIPTFSSN